MKKWDVIGLRFAFSGLSILLQQRNFRIEVVLAFLAIGLGFYLQINAQAWLWISLAITLVLAGEAINTAFELTLDRVGRDYHPTTKQAKDIAAGAVVICCLHAIVIGFLVFGPRLWALLFA
ncbi:MAG TPA: diacylglycerol kinase [Bacteroidetes bacterium]|nr:diacylglycerol kinase [Bacteroidota bacterium]|tara:strand:+ start:245 stop:607 length:363 start_codon:yes stop_codon:yes gene_type:complete